MATAATATASHPASASTSGRDALAASSSSPSSPPPCHRPSAAQPPSSSTSSPPAHHSPFVAAAPPPSLLAAMDAGDDEQPVLLDHVARATRGKRITKLLEDEIEQDEVFWNQVALKDEWGFSSNGTRLQHLSSRAAAAVPDCNKFISFTIV